MRIVESEGGLEGCTGLSGGDRDALEPTETREEGKARLRSREGWWLARKPRFLFSLTILGRCLQLGKLVILRSCFWTEPCCEVPLPVVLKVRVSSGRRNRDQELTMELRVSDGRFAGVIKV
jgi:hypothetical protein